jgi:hypothetical protein
MTTRKGVAAAQAAGPRRIDDTLRRHDAAALFTDHYAYR